jgi:GMP synthase-like glutamine amidotransferase
LLKIHWFQHVPFEGLGKIEEWSQQKNHRLDCTRFHRKDPLPDIHAIDWLVVMGGPMNIYEEDRYPWLHEEKEFLKKAIDAGKTVIGICLGAQLIADVLGSRVYAGPQKEIGWFPIHKSAAAGKTSIFKDLPDTLEVFHWHGDTFDLPSGCVHIAESKACRSQAFLYEERVAGLQFHLEMTREGIEEIVFKCRQELVNGPFIQSAEEIAAGTERLKETHRIMEGILNRLEKRRA